MITTLLFLSAAFLLICLRRTGGNMHAANEWVDIEEIKTVLKIYLKYLFEC